eukprot:TRINITY_DN7257_c0_g1_i1.p2 TRINITY_DN7257_c0_g1~~TRINITY_DN7257_c0_g1_i1.p2  ORF type:complete len:178 (-),score=32.01 TRINITY_DN7257_c0_g1_i1:238-771(-)
MEVEGEIPPPRKSFLYTLHNDRMYIFGGWNNVTRFNDMYYLELDRQPMRWIRVDQGGEIPGVRHDASGAQFEKEGRRYWIMWGGAAGYNLIKNDFIHWQEVMAFDFEEMTWMVIPTDTAPPPGVEGHRYLMTKLKMIIKGVGSIESAYLCTEATMASPSSKICIGSISMSRHGIRAQ